MWVCAGVSGCVLRSALSTKLRLFEWFVRVCVRIWIAFRRFALAVSVLFRCSPCHSNMGIVCCSLYFWLLCLACARSWVDARPHTATHFSLCITWKLCVCVCVCVSVRVRVHACARVCVSAFVPVGFVSHTFFLAIFKLMSVVLACLCVRVFVCSPI